MRALIQRVSRSSVVVDGETIAEIGPGLLVLLGIERDDDTGRADRMIDKLLAYRVFADDAGKMNLSVSDCGGGVLLVSQFTLAADTSKGLRPGFSSAADPLVARQLYQYTSERLAPRCSSYACGQFGADMKVSLVNDGPVTFLLQT